MSKIDEIKKMLDEAVPSLECTKEMRHLLSRLEIAQKALEFYANNDNNDWSLVYGEIDQSNVMRDDGYTAKEALEQLKEE